MLTMTKPVVRHKKTTLALEPDGFSIHTFEISRKLTEHEWTSVKSALYDQNTEPSNPKAVTYPDPNFSEDHICFAYSKHGIRIRLEHRKDFHYIRMIVNPRRLIDPDSSYLGILPPSDESIDKLEKAFRKLFNETTIENDITKYYLSRVDLCVNIRCSNRRVFRELVRLLRKTATPAKYKRLKYKHNDKKKQNRYNKHYLRIKCNSQELVIYDKAYQLDENGLVVDYEKLPEGVLRVEVHYWRDKLRTIERKSNIDNPLDLLRKLMTKSKEKILKLVEKCYPNLSYFSIENANTQILRSHLSEDTKERMQVLVKLMQRKQSLDAAFKQMENDGKKTDDLQEQFAKLGLNPIPLRVGFCVNRMPSLVEILSCVEDEPVVVELQELHWK